MSQVTALISYLKENGSITPLQALSDLGIMRLAARILEIRGKGYSIDTDISKSLSGKRYARYIYRGKK